MTDPGPAPAEHADTHTGNGTRRAPALGPTGADWLDDFPAVPAEPDLGRPPSAGEQPVIRARPATDHGQPRGHEATDPTDDPRHDDQHHDDQHHDDQHHDDQHSTRPHSFRLEGSGAGSDPVATPGPGPDPEPDRIPDRNEVPELRQIAGLTAGTVIPLDRPSLAFAEGDSEVGFRLEVAPSGRVDVLPEAAVVTVDANPVGGRIPVGLGALDVGSARFLVRPRGRAIGDWPDDRQLAEYEPPVIEVPPDLAPGDEGRGRRRRRLLGGSSEPERETLDAASWEFVEMIREARGEMAERLRALHPDPADLADRARYDASALGFRRRGEARFAEVGVLCADISWMPRFDDIGAIPESLGDHLRPLMSLPSVPIVADLLIGPLGITGPRRAAMACARHLALALYGMSSDELMLHIVTDRGRADDWRWATHLAPEQRIDPRFGYPVLVVDGAHNFPGTTGIDHQKVIDGRAGLVVLADAVEQLPSYCGTVLQVDRTGSGVLTNHRAQVIKGTPIGVTESLAGELSIELVRVLSRRR